MVTIDNLVKILKTEFKVNKDKELASIFNVTPNTFSIWKKNKEKMMEQVIKLGIEKDLDINKIFMLCKGGNLESKTGGCFPILMADNLYSYYLNPSEIVRDIPKCLIPGDNNYKIGFQLISQNMEPTIKVSSLVFGHEVGVSDLREKEVYAFVVKDAGFFISRFGRSEEKGYVFENDNDRYEDFIFDKNMITSIFKIKGVLSKVN